MQQKFSHFQFLIFKFFFDIFIVCTQMLWDHQSAVTVLAVQSTEMIINHVKMCCISTKAPLKKVSVKQTSADSEHRVPDGATEVPLFSISSIGWFHLEIFQ